MSRARPFTPKVVTANLLRDGDVVYRTLDGDWTLDLPQAAVFGEAEAADAALAEAAAESLVVVGAYLADVEATPDGPVPVHFREDFRAEGPTNYEHGKAAGQRPGPLDS